ncbi:MAG TPA: DJ-1/PfpI family protein [Polyangiaceae bacterium]|nr:DJ-1/PfpI family protein [Polyangiaceae bacterium]
MTASIDIVFALFPNVTQLDFTGPYEVLQRLPGARLTLASREGGALTSDSRLSFSGLARLSEVASADVLCVPGGYGVTAALGDREFLSEVRRLGQSARYITSVCSGSLILAGAGLLAGKRAACHWSWRPLLAEQGVTVENARVVRDGNVITGGGVTAGIDFALTLAAEVAGVEAAQRIQLSIEYDPAPPFDAGDPERAPALVVATLRERVALQYPDRRAALAALRA